MADTYVIDAKGRAVIDKDKDAVLDYPFDWTSYLAPIADVILSAQLVTDQGSALVVTSYSFDNNTVTAWVSGGTAGLKERLTCRITTAGGRTDDRSIYLNIKDR